MQSAMTRKSREVRAAIDESAGWVVKGGWERNPPEDGPPTVLRQPMGKYLGFVPCTDPDSSRLSTPPASSLLATCSFPFPFASLIPFFPFPLASLIPYPLSLFPSFPLPISRSAFQTFPLPCLAA